MLELNEYHASDTISLKEKKKTRIFSGSISFAPILFEISDSTEHVEHSTFRVALNSLSNHSPLTP